MKKDLIRISSLWIKTDKNGNIYYAGNMGGDKIVAFKNTNKVEGSNSPDYVLYRERVENNKGPQ